MKKILAILFLIYTVIFCFGCSGGQQTVTLVGYEEGIPTKIILNANGDTITKMELMMSFYNLNIEVSDANEEYISKLFEHYVDKELPQYSDATGVDIYVEQEDETWILGVAMDLKNEKLLNELYQDHFIQSKDTRCSLKMTVEDLEERGYIQEK